MCSGRGRDTSRPRIEASTPSCDGPLPVSRAAALAEAFVSTPFSNDPRHQRRIDMLTEYERTGVPPALPADQVPG